MKVAFLGNAHIHTQDYARACLADRRVQIVGAACTEPAPYAFPDDVPIFEAATDLPEHDLCVVTSDVASHPALVAQAQVAHVFVEKPIGASESAAREVARTILASDSAFHTGLFLRHGQPVRDLRAALNDGLIGTVREVDLTYAHHGMTAGWLREWSAHLDMNRMGYGVFGDLAAHLIDLASWCLGPLAAESCKLTIERGTDVAGRGVMRATNGVLVRLSAGALAEGRDLTLRFAGDSGTLAIANDALILERPDRPFEQLSEPADLTPGMGFRAVLNAVADGKSSDGASLEAAVATNTALDALYARAERAERSASAIGATS